MGHVMFHTIGAVVGTDGKDCGGICCDLCNEEELDTEADGFYRCKICDYDLCNICSIDIGYEPGSDVSKSNQEQACLEREELSFLASSSSESEIVDRTQPDQKAVDEAQPNHDPIGRAQVDHDPQLVNILKQADCEEFLEVLLLNEISTVELLNLVKDKDLRSLGLKLGHIIKLRKILQKNGDHVAGNNTLNPLKTKVLVVIRAERLERTDDPRAYLEFPEECTEARMHEIVWRESTNLFKPQLQTDRKSKYHCFITRKNVKNDYVNLQEDCEKIFNDGEDTLNMILIKKITYSKNSSGSEWTCGLCRQSGIPSEDSHHRTQDHWVVEAKREFLLKQDPAMCKQVKLTKKEKKSQVNESIDRSGERMKEFIRAGADPEFAAKLVSRVERGEMELSDAWKLTLRKKSKKKKKSKGKKRKSKGKHKMRKKKKTEAFKYYAETSDSDEEDMDDMSSSESSTSEDP